jgi:hypothetical protein
MLVGRADELQLIREALAEVTRRKPAMLVVSGGRSSSPPAALAAPVTPYRPGWPSEAAAPAQSTSSDMATSSSATSPLLLTATNSPWLASSR